MMTFSKKTILFSLIILLVMGGGLLALLGSEPREAPKTEQPPAASQQQEHQITIGILAHLSGPLSSFGESIEKGARTAEEVINKSGGISSKQLRLRVFDTRSRPELASEFFKELVEREDAKLVIGTTTKEATLHAAKAARESQTPLIYLTPGRIMTCDPKNRSKPSPYVWGAGLTDLMRTEPLLIFLADSFRPTESKFRISYLTTDKEETRIAAEFARDSAESMSFVTVDEQVIDERIGDYYQYLRVIFHKKAEVLFLSLSEKALVPTIEQAAKIGVKSDYKLSSLINFEEERLRAASDSANELLTVTSYALDLDNTEQKLFLETWERMFKDQENTSPPTALAAMTYSALLTAKAAFEHAGNFSAESFQKAMIEVDVKTPQGELIVDRRNHQFILPLYAVSFEKDHYKLAEYLGNVSHPLLQGCAVAPEESEK